MTIPAPAKAGFQKFTAAHRRVKNAEFRKFPIAPITLTFGEAGSNSDAITKKPTRIQSNANLTQPNGFIPKSRTSMCLRTFGALPRGGSTGSTFTSVKPNYPFFTIST